jgi:outer membrane lipoprotein SlyB
VGEDACICWQAFTFFGILKTMNHDAAWLTENSMPIIEITGREQPMLNLKQYLSFGLMGALLLLTGCATTGGNQAGEMEIRSGVIEQIKDVQIQSNHHRGVGAVVGGLTGLGIGSLIGGGTGRDVAMVLGAVGGAVAGNEVQKKYDAPKPGQQIIVRTTSGVLVSVTQPTVPGLWVGERVYIEGNGESARVRPQ